MNEAAPIIAAVAGRVAGSLAAKGVAKGVASKVGQGAAKAAGRVAGSAVQNKVQKKLSNDQETQTEEVMTAGTGGFSGSAAATGPNAGYDPVLNFRKKVQKRKTKEDKKLVMPGNKLGESKENPTMPSRLFQYKVTVPEIGETIVYASSPAELMQKMRLLVNYRYRGDIKIERIMPAAAGKFFMDKRMNHLRNRK
jgi:hypothetical protein